MQPHKLAVLHDHYRDSCSLMQKLRAARDRNFYFVVALMAVAWFDVVAPRDFATLAGEVIKARLQLTTAPDLAYLRGVLWFLLLAVTIRYCQLTLAVERSYDYVHKIEPLLAAEVDPAFNREGAGYLSDYPLFLNWAQCLYVWVSPSLLLALVVAWTRAQLPASWPWAWPGLVVFEAVVCMGIIVTVCLYWAFQIGRWLKARRATKAQSPAPPEAVG